MRFAPRRSPRLSRPLSPRSRRGSAPAVAANFATGAGYLVVSRYVVAVMGWGGTILIVHRLSTAAWGSYSLIFAVFGIVGMVSDLRLGRIVMRQMAGAQDLEQVVGSYVTFRFVIGILAYAVSVAVIAAGRYPTSLLLATVVAGTLLLLASIGTSLDVLFLAKFWSRSMGAAMVAGQAVQMFLTIGLYVAGTKSIMLFAVPAVVCEVVALGWRLRALPRHLHVRWRVDMPAWRTWLREVVPLAVGGAIATVYLRVDMVMISEMRSLDAVGQYAIGYKFSDLVDFVPVALSGTLLATLTTSWPGDEAAYARAVRKGATVLAMAAGAVVFEFAFFTRPAIGLLYGPRYEVASLATQGLVGAVLVSFFSSMCFTALVSVGRNRLYPIAALVGLLINVGLNMVVIPMWSYNGAALATIVTEVAVFAVLGAAVRKLPGFGALPWPQVARIGVAGLLASGVAAVTRSVMPWEMAAVLALLSYGGMLAVLRAGGDLVDWPPRQLDRLWRSAPSSRRSIDQPDQLARSGVSRSPGSLDGGGQSRRSPRVSSRG